MSRCEILLPIVQYSVLYASYNRNARYIYSFILQYIMIQSSIQFVFIEIYIIIIYEEFFLRDYARRNVVA